MVKTDVKLNYLRALMAIARSGGCLKPEELDLVRQAAGALRFDGPSLKLLTDDVLARAEIDEMFDLESLSIADRCRLLRDAYLIAWSDELVTPDEQRSLQSLVELLGLTSMAASISIWVEAHIAQQRRWAQIVEDATMGDPPPPALDLDEY